MKTINLYIILFLHLSFNISTYSQSVSIELSAKWVKGYDIFQKDSTIYYPELIITYRNNSDTNYYFQKISDSRCGLPMLPWGTLLQYPIEEYLNPNYLKRAKMHENFANDNYKVIIGGDASFSKGWIIVNDTVDIEVEQEQEIDMVNDDLADIYEYIYREIFSKQPDTLNEVKTHYIESDLIPEVIIDKFKDKFVFLMPGETCIDTYNLIGFKLLKGGFTFCICPYLPTYVYTTPIWDKNQSKYIETKTMLPKLVGEYKLYSGNFNSNKIAITF
ncbi:MAG: hypothetical protein KKG99_13755 [Bacteroidetes bacterium]|nr:hypothetical protein [Bacteroidota bacterium]